MTNSFFGIIESWISNALPNLTEIIRKNQQLADSPRPDKPYSVIQLRASTPYSSTPYVYCSEDIDPDDSQDVLQYHSEQRNTILVVDLYSETSMDDAAQLQLSIHTPSSLEIFRANDIALSTIGTVLDTTELRDISHDPSAQLEFTLAYTGQLAEGVAWINEINVEIDTDGS